ncbi:hypothetical protein I6N96_01745 [Enterococcus sp. BWM-S5]|uniref:Uncharacterized protein n=1 Tax=Enterococcus larvae TaxID=2794352 RepID=A0ABS4CEE6_9ENTE|nr:hypothetical protein [Enterococcus larvae]MBP1044985.1 hypothetical protein [Enterococcus larvae]
MKIRIVESTKDFIDNHQVRWYPSSQEIWIGTVVDYKEIETKIATSFGSFRWLLSDVDTLLFDKNSLQLTTAIIKVSEPIKILESSSKLFSNIEEKKGSVELCNSENFSSEIGNFSYYSTLEDILISCKELPSTGDEKVVFLEISIDTSFIIKDSEIIGIVLKNASLHLLPSELSNISMDYKKNNERQKILINYLRLINMLDMDLSDEEEESLKNDFKHFYEKIKSISDMPIKAISESVNGVIDFM